MTEKSTIIVKPSAARQFESFWERGKVLFFSAPCGIGKMALADTLLERYPVLRLHAGEASFTLPSLEDAWQTLLIDDLQYMQEEQGEHLAALFVCRTKHLTSAVKSCNLSFG